MERNEEALSTRDLASPSDPPAEAVSEAEPQQHDAQGRDGASTSQAQGVATAASPAGTDTTSGEPLLTSELSTTFQRRWEEIQTRFVDEPRGAVEDADGLVANLMQQLAEGFAQHRERLEAQWDRGEDISTEDLRVALQRYRSFFQRLLST